MRYQEDHKEKTHRKIVERASQEFRTHGFEGVGIAKLMSRLNLTHGGFYAHFQDKEDLKDQAMDFALDHSMKIASEVLQRGGILAYIDHYISDLHRDHPGFGCALPSLTAEEGRRSPESKARFAQKYDALIAVLAGYIPGDTLDEKRSHAHFILSALSGSVALSRATGDPVLSAAVLQSTRQHLTNYITSL